MLGSSLTFLMLTDSRLSFDIIARDRYETDLCLMVDIAAAGKACNEDFLVAAYLSGGTRTSEVSAPKSSHNNYLDGPLTSGKLIHPAEQHIVSETIS